MSARNLFDKLLQPDNNCSRDCQVRLMDFTLNNIINQWKTESVGHEPLEQILIIKNIPFLHGISDMTTLSFNNLANLSEFAFFKKRSNI